MDPLLPQPCPQQSGQEDGVRRPHCYALQTPPQPPRGVAPPRLPVITPLAKITCPPFGVNLSCLIASVTVRKPNHFSDGELVPMSLQDICAKDVRRQILLLAGEGHFDLAVARVRRQAVRHRFLEPGQQFLAGQSSGAMYARQETATYLLSAGAPVR